jgi:hypothetical protein
LKRAAVVGELNHEELRRLPEAAVAAIVESDLLNDLRTVFLIHDKRFFSVLGNADFLNSAIGQQAADRFRQYLVPTYTWQERPDLWERARRDKGSWIVKPSVLGKGVGVKAGCLTSESDWQALFLQKEAEDLSLQPYIAQRKFHGWVGNENRHDYAVGTLLFFEDGFYGPGLFRASSHPITNMGDDRKISPLVTGDVQFFEGATTL